jgi:hypothetical protein
MPRSSGAAPSAAATESHSGDPVRPSLPAAAEGIIDQSWPARDKPGRPFPAERSQRTLAPASRQPVASRTIVAGQQIHEINHRQWPGTARSGNPVPRARQAPTPRGPRQSGKRRTDLGDDLRQGRVAGCAASGAVWRIVVVRLTGRRRRVPARPRGGYPGRLTQPGKRSQVARRIFLSTVPWAGRPVSPQQINRICMPATWVAAPSQPVHSGGSWQARKEVWLPTATRPLQRCARGWLVWSWLGNARRRDGLGGAVVAGVLAEPAGQERVAG